MRYTCAIINFRISDPALAQGNPKQTAYIYYHQNNECDCFWLKDITFAFVLQYVRVSP